MLTHHQLKGIIKARHYYKMDGSTFRSSGTNLKVRITWSFFIRQACGTACIRLQREPRRNCSHTNLAGKSTALKYWPFRMCITFAVWVSQSRHSHCLAMAAADPETRVAKSPEGCQQRETILWRGAEEDASGFWFSWSWKKRTREQEKKGGGQMNLGNCAVWKYKEIRLRDLDLAAQVVESAISLVSLRFLDIFFSFLPNTKKLSGSSLLQDHVTASSKQCLAIIHKLRGYFI